MQTFFGVEVTPGKVAPFVPPPVEAPLHISQATLSFDAKAGERVGVTAKVDEDGPDVLICSLREGTSESQSLDLIFDSYAEFKVVGNASVHLTGYYMPEHDHEDEESDEDEEDEDEEDTDEDEEMANISPADLRALAAYSRKHGMPMDDEDDDEDDEEDDEDDDEDEDDDIARQAGVIIRELNQDGSAKSDTDEDEDDDEDDEEDDEDDDEDVPAGGVQIDEDIDRATVQLDDTIRAIGAAAEASAKRKGAAADKERSSSKRAKKAADVARATAEDLIMQAMEDAEDDIEAAEDDAEDDKAPGANGEDIIDVAAAAGPAVEDVAAAAAEIVDAGAAAAKPLSKKEKKKRAKEAAANGQIKVKAAEPASNSVPIKHTRPKVQKFDNGFIIEDTHMGPARGKEAKPGNKVGVRYKGWLAKNNQVFDQTKGSKTFNFRVGVGEVIKGWDRGVVGMRPGDKRRLTVPPQMAYGPTGVKGAIPGNATLVFDVELVDVKGK